MAMITGTTCKIMIHEKEKHSQAKAGEETTVVAGETPRGTQPCPSYCWRCGHQDYRHTGVFKLKKVLQGLPTPGVDFPKPNLRTSVPMPPRMGHFLPIGGKKGE